MSEPQIEERLVSTASKSEEELVDLGLRPRMFSEYVGQEQVKNQMGVFIEAARQRAEALDHVLVVGPPCLRKISLAGIIAAELGVSLCHTSGPGRERQGDLAV